MSNGVLGPLRAVTLKAVTLVAMVAVAPVGVAGQQAEPSDMVNQREATVLEAAREASPLTADEAAKYFEAEVARKTAEAIATVWDPDTPRQPSPRTPWGDPDLRGYWMVESYTPLQRPDGVTKAFYTPEEAVQAFVKAAAEDSAVDPATVHYDWKEFGMDTWQSPVRPNLRTSLIVDPLPEGFRRSRLKGGSGS